MRTPTLSLAALALAAATAAQGQFAESVKTYFPLHHSGSSGVAVGDVDGDGKQDLLYAHGWVVFGAQSRLFRGDGQGAFTDVTATHLPQLAANSQDVALADLDGDGDLDAYLGDYWSDRLWLNDGAGHFTDATFGRLPPDVVDTRRVAFGDYDQDGDLDVATADYHLQRMLVNDGTGHFTDLSAARVPFVDVSVWGVWSVDLDQDQDLDLLMATYGGPLLWLNDGAGKFTDVTAARLPAGAGDSAFATGDVDGDGDLDLVAVNWLKPAQLLLNDGTTKFVDASLGRLPAIAGYSWTASLADLDQDGDLDLVISDMDVPDHLLQNDGTGRFTDVTATHMPANETWTGDIVPADLDQDGDLDLAQSDSSMQQRALLNDGQARFSDTSPARIMDPNSNTLALALGDMDQDGDLDLVTGNGSNGQWDYGNKLFRNDGNGFFANASLTHMPQDADDARAVVLADVDGDGDLDAVFGNAGTAARLYRNTGNGVLVDASSQLPAINDTVTSLACGDLDGDGDRDLIVGAIGSNRLWRNDGSGTFADVTVGRLPAAATETRALVLGDLDGDGDLDAVAANGLTRAVPETMYLNDGSGTFADASSRLPVNFHPTASLALGDVDGDGDLDLVVGNDDLYYGRPNELWINDGSASFVDASYSRMVYDTARTLALALGDVDEDGDLDILCGDYDQPNKLYVNDGTGKFNDGTLLRMPGDLENTTALAMGDIDGDGDLDLVSAGAGFVRLETIAYANHHRQVWSPRLPRLGRPYQIDVLSRAGYATQPQSAVVLLGGAPASIPLGALGTLKVSPAGMAQIPLGLTPPAGKGSVVLPIPPIPALAGLPFWVQAVVLPSSDPSLARLTNVLAERIVQ